MPSELQAPAAALTAERVKPAATRRVLGSGALAAVVLLALVVAGSHVAQRLRALTAGTLEVKMLSPTRFGQELARRGDLIVLRSDGTAEHLVCRRYAAAFLDPRTTFSFEVQGDEVAELLLRPAPPGQVVAIEAISFRPAGEETRLSVPLDAVEPAQQTEIVEQSEKRLLIRMISGEGAPLVRLKLDAFPVSHKPDRRAQVQAWAEAVVIFVIALLASLGVFRMWRRQSEARPFWRNIPLRTALPLTLATVLITTMALRSSFNAHPDEYLHFETARYFASHWLPGGLGDRAIEPTFSHYGFSYLQDLDGAYVVAGRFMALIPQTLAEAETAARLFNVLLFAVLAVALATQLQGSRATWVLLISPQIWYVFSYINADAWALAVSFLLVAQLASTNSALHRFLSAARWRESLYGGLGFAALLLLLLMAKRNFYLLFPFVLLVAGWQILFWQNGAPRWRLAQRWALIFALTGAVYLPIRLGHEALNGFQSAKVRIEQAEQFAAPNYRPSEMAAGGGAAGLNLRSRGMSFQDILIGSDWARGSFESFCGVYHWMTLSSRPPYYLLMGGLYAALLATLLIMICRRSWPDALFATATLGLMVGMVLLSAWHSWTGDFQPQGRYLFPILPLLAFLLHRYRDSLRSKAFDLLFLGLFAGSVFSFVYTGLRQIPQ